MRDHLARNLPYAFIGQVDLEKAARLGPVAEPLPHEGRLLFFYDNMIGPWDTGTRAARVIWDKSPADALVSIPAPKDLTKAAARERKEWADMEAEVGTSEKRRAEKGTNYAAPARPVELQLTYRLPVPAALEYERFDDPSGARPGDGKDQEAPDFRAGYEEVLQEFHDQYPEGWRRQQLLGAPMPEQDDPRLDAVVVTEFGRQHLPRAEWLQRRTEIFAEAREWVLLLQVDLGDWMRASFVEGSIFFVIHRDDLKNRRFEKVVAVYQQT